MTTSTPRPAPLAGLERLHSGKVRDIYAVGDDALLLVASDRLSAFDVVLPQALPGKGAVLTEVAAFWFERTADIVPNHVLTTDVDAMPEAVRAHRDALAGRSMLVRRAEPLKAEFVVRGYLAGSGWNDYRRTGGVCGIHLPEGLLESDRLPEPILTPSTKAPAGEHDENITLDELDALLGAELAAEARRVSLALYDHAATHCARRGILLADTKFEFGLIDGALHVIDEVFTPDSSRYWSVADYAPGRSQDSFDKQIVRDALLATGWDKTPPAPELPSEVLDRTMARYREIAALLTGPPTAS